MYYAVGTRLGLDLQRISIPGGRFISGHAAVDLLDNGKRIQIEPTNPNGFDWKSKINQPGVIAINTVPNRKKYGRDVNGLGIAAIIYSNRGVDLTGRQPPRTWDAARCYLAALAMNPADASATNKLIAVFVSSAAESSEGGDFEGAVRLISFCREFAPDSKRTEEAAGLVWSQYVDSLLESGRDIEAVTIIRRAAMAMPLNRDVGDANRCLIRFSRRRMGDDDWEAALAVVDRAAKVLPADQVTDLHAWRSRVYRLWSQSLLDKRDFSGSLSVLSRAYMLDPRDRKIQESMEHHARAALREMEDESGLAAAIDYFQALRTRFHEVSRIGKAGRMHAQSSLIKLTDAKKYQQAVEAVDKYSSLVENEKQRSELGAIVFDSWGRHLKKSEDWRANLDKYQEGLSTYPKQRTLTNNLIATIGWQADIHMKAKDWNEAARVYEIGLEYLPGDRSLERSKRYCEKMFDSTARSTN